MMGELTPAQASALSLLLRHGQSYADVGRRLQINPMSVRARAHEAAAVLAGLEPGSAGDGPLIDQALGQLPTWEAAALNTQLDDPEGVAKLELLTERLESFLIPRVAWVDTSPATESLALERVPRGSSVAGTAMVRRARPQRSRRHAVSTRMGAMLSLGVGFLAAGGVLFINGAH